MNAMLRTYFIVAIRNLLRNKTMSFIQIGGFALGIAVFLVGARFMLFEYSYDNFHEKRDRIFLLPSRWIMQGNLRKMQGASPAMAVRINDELPEVQAVARCIQQSLQEPYCVVTYTDELGNKISYNEKKAMYVDEGFFRIFSFPVVWGARDSLFSDVSAVVLTQSTARKYFGRSNPVGKMLHVTTGGHESLKTRFVYRVAGVVSDVPANSSLDFDILFPFRNFQDNYKYDIKNFWAWASFPTFVLLKDGVKVNELEAKLNRDYPPVEEKSYWKERGLTTSVSLLPLKQVHFSQDYEMLDEQTDLHTSNKVYVLSTGIVSLIILIIAGINYTNLATAQALKRVKEVTVRKIIGADRRQLIIQFLVEASVINVIGITLAITLIQASGSMLSEWTGFAVPEISWTGGEMLTFLLVVLAGTTIFGLGPALFVSRLHPLWALKGSSSGIGKWTILRKSLLVFQFFAAIILMIFTYAVHEQIKHMKLKDPGFRPQRRLVIDALGTEDFDFTKFRRFRELAKHHAGVSNITAAYNLPGAGRTAMRVMARADSPDEYKNMAEVYVDYDFASTLGIDVVAGREFLEEYKSDVKEVMLNESAVKALGFESPAAAIGQSVIYLWTGPEGNQHLKIVGVLKDFDSSSTGDSFNSTYFLFANSVHPGGNYRFYVVQLEGSDLAGPVSSLHEDWQEVFPGSPFQYSFLDDRYASVFAGEEELKSISGVSSFVAIAIACIGLLGLVSYTTGQRTKEIGIRKILGSSVPGIVFLLSGSLLRPVMLAILVAIPTAWMAVSSFLEGYQYSMPVTVKIFAVPVLLLLGSAFLALGVQTLKAALANPVKSLRYE